MSIANRAAIVLSANAFLIAGSMFLVDKVTSGSVRLGGTPITVMVLLLSSALLLLIVSTLIAAMCIGNIGRPSRKSLAPDEENKFNEELPRREVFHPTDLVDTVNRFDEFESRCESYTADTLRKAALAELWTMTKSIHRRYQQLRWAVRFLVVGVAVYVPGLVAFLVTVAWGSGN